MEIIPSHDHIIFIPNVLNTIEIQLSHKTIAPTIKGKGIYGLFYCTISCYTFSNCSKDRRFANIIINYLLKENLENESIEATVYQQHINLI